jgi:1-deoxy-D-xylulose-5-phosphate reductoisomerase
MELPVLYALTHPERVHDAGVPPYDPVELSPLTFERVRWDDFPALRLGIDAGRAGGALPAVFNAANEEAVAQFLDGRITFGGIAPAIDGAMRSLADRSAESLDALRAADCAARTYVKEMVAC